MTRRAWVGLLLATGCGPLDRPLPVTLPADQQQKVQEVWDGALRPPDKIDRLVWLDVLATGRLYQLGVDKLDMRSEKRWAGGTVVMEAHYDRTDPPGDRFTLTVLDAAGEVLRTERFDRAEVDDAVAMLGLNIPDPTPGEPAELTARRAAHRTRQQRVNAVLDPLGVAVNP